MADVHIGLPRRLVLVAALLVAASSLLSAGCEVVEVIDGIGKDPKAEAAAAAAAKQSADDESAGAMGAGTPKAKLEAYYKRSRSDKGREDDPDDPIVQCETGGSVLFIRKYDCQMRRGRILG
jgi:hypothetical protein